jgi:hypothetical protein
VRCVRRTIPQSLAAKGRTRDCNRGSSYTRDPSSEVDGSTLRFSAHPLARQPGPLDWPSFQLGELVEFQREGAGPCQFSVLRKRDCSLHGMATPRAGVDYPRSFGELQAWFRTDGDCLDYLEWLRWPFRFVRPCCGNAGGWPFGGRPLRGDRHLPASGATAHPSAGSRTSPASTHNGRLGPASPGGQTKKGAPVEPTTRWFTASAQRTPGTLCARRDHGEDGNRSGCGCTKPKPRSRTARRRTVSVRLATVLSARLCEVAQPSSVG